MMCTLQNLEDSAKVWRHTIPTIIIPGYISEVFLTAVLKSCGGFVLLDLMLYVQTSI